MAKEIIQVMKRYELKYHLTKEQVSFFKANILNHMKVDKYGLTTISSLYYDTTDFSLINRSIEKPLFKEKIRLRSYGISSKNSPVFLEIKRKNENVVYKRRIVSTEEKVNRFIQEGEEFDKSQISRELEAFRENYKVLEPKYLIIYDRIAYYQDNSDLRITLDLNPRYRVENLDLHTSLKGTPLLEEGEALLEIKVQHSVPLWLVEILTKGKIYQTSFSKVGKAHTIEMNKKHNHEVLINEPIYSYQKGEKQYGFTI